MTNFISFLDGGKTSQEGLYKFLSRTLGPGVPTAYNAASLAVSQRGAGANMSVDIAIGDAHIPYSTYSFWGFTDAVNNVTVSASDPSNPRRDIVVAYVDLSVVSSASNNNPGALKFKVIAGTPAGSPSDPSDTVIGLNVGAGNPWVKLARLSIAANATTVVNANITDLRTAVLPLVPDGGLITAKYADSSVTTAKLATGAVTPAKQTNPYMFSVYRAAAWTVIHGGSKVPFDTVEYDLNSNFDITTNNRYTAPVAGYYKFDSSVSWQQTTGDFTYIVLYKNGTAIKYGTFFVAPGNNTVGHVISPPPIHLAVNDYVEIYAFQTNGSINMVGGVGATICYFGGHLVRAD